uniref:Testis-specific serine/threonine-protein kinase 3 n=1 Tax=Cacopsylla melanoneura TaxID=428564 RepID=A0A8D8W4R4_9HEMI
MSATKFINEISEKYLDTTGSQAKNQITPESKNPKHDRTLEVNSKRSSSGRCPKLDLDQIVKNKIAEANLNLRDNNNQEQNAAEVNSDQKEFNVYIRPPDDLYPNQETSPIFPRNMVPTSTLTCPVPPCSIERTQLYEAFEGSSENKSFPSIMNISYTGKLGAGAYGKVYSVKDRTTGEVKACKTYDLRKIKEEYVSKYAPREIDIFLKVSHPNIITMHMICKAGFSLYMLMDIAELKDMEYYITRLCDGNINESQAKIWIKQIASALDYLHEIGVAHRDIKCENILITRCLTARLTDFGFSRFFKNAKELSSTFCGTTGYASPEIMKNISYNASKADIWAFGVVLYRILSKRYPFGEPGTRVRTLIHRMENQDYTFSGEFNISMEAKKLIKRMLTPNPTQRPTARDVHNDAWCLGALTPLKLYEDQRDALLMGKVKCKQFQQRFTVVDALIQTNVLEITAESKGKKYADSGENVPDERVYPLVCAPTSSNI